MSQRPALRIGGGGAVVGGVVTLVGNILHPRESGQLDDAESLLDVAARSDLWVTSHFVILIGLAVLLGGFYGLARSIAGEPGTAWARLAFGFATIGTVFGIALMLTEATAVAEVADRWANSSGTEKDLALASGSPLYELSLTFAAGGALFLVGLTPVLYGVAMLRSTEYAPWLGWAGVVFGAIGVAAGVLDTVTDLTTLAQFVLFPIAAAGLTFWMIYLGTLMWRRSAEPVDVK
jgi:TM2 domain-containing membrane protein YozV